MFRTKVTFTEGQTPEQRKAHAALWRRLDESRRAQCNLLEFWRVCAKPVCRRNRTCSGDMHACFKRHWALFPEDQKEWVRGALLAARDGAKGEALGRAADARRAEYLKSLETGNAIAPEPASPRVADVATLATPAEVRIRRL